jgi:hypothetical protein
VTIVRTSYRYKRPPRRKTPVALEVPTVITPAGKRRRASDEAKAALAASIKLPPGDLERKPAIATSRASSGVPAKSAIVTVRRRAERDLPPGLLADTPEEHKRRGDAADAIFRDIVRRIGEKT